MRAVRLVGVALLVASGLNLTLMIPGGPIEARDFSAIAPAVLGGFNLFLTLLGVGSFVLAYFMVTGRIKGDALAALVGLSYVAVYVLDLAEVFPVSPTPMPTLLFWMEWAGTVLGGGLIITSCLGLVSASTDVTESAGADLPRPVMYGLLILMCGIVAFATYAAMGG